MRKRSHLFVIAAVTLAAGAINVGPVFAQADPGPGAARGADREDRAQEREKERREERREAEHDYELKRHELETRMLQEKEIREISERTGWRFPDSPRPMSAEHLSKLEQDLKEIQAKIAALKADIKQGKRFRSGATGSLKGLIEAFEEEESDKLKKLEIREAEITKEIEAAATTKSDVGSSATTRPSTTQPSTTQPSGPVENFRD